MGDRIIILAALFLIYFHISGLATTNMLRLTKGNTVPVLASKCYCDSCGAAIPPHLQLPIISYIACRGRCRSCGVRIPVFPLVLELAVLGGMFLITAVGGCAYWAVSASFLFYELMRIVTVLRLGKRETQFARQYVIAVLAMVPFYLLTMFVAVIYTLV